MGDLTIIVNRGATETTGLHLDDVLVFGRILIRGGFKLRDEPGAPVSLYLNGIRSCHFQISDLAFVGGFCISNSLLFHVELRRCTLKGGVQFRRSRLIVLVWVDNAGEQPQFEDVDLQLEDVELLLDPRLYARRLKSFYLGQTDLWLILGGYRPSWRDASHSLQFLSAHFSWRNDQSRSRVVTMLATLVRKPQAMSTLLAMGIWLLGLSLSAWLVCGALSATGLLEYVPLLLPAGLFAWAVWRGARSA